MKYRILSLDGGGVHGLATVVLLKRISERFPQFFNGIDFIAGTSIGGILALGLACGHSIAKIESNFYEGIPLAFYRNLSNYLLFPLGLREKYDNSKFAKFLTILFGKQRMESLSKKVLVTSFLLDDRNKINRSWRAKLFHNFEGPDSDGKTFVKDVALATSSAILYFKSHGRYVDGSIVASNPSVCAIAQTQDKNALIVNRPSLDDIVLLSIGDKRNIYVEGKNLHWGWLKWLEPMVYMFNDGDVECINYQCRKFLGERFHRTEPIIDGAMDNFKESAKIANIAEKYPLQRTFAWLEKYWL
jgi:patatin-like phospholipase/acyl hydrolase